MDTDRQTPTLGAVGAMRDARADAFPIDAWMRLSPQGAGGDDTRTHRRVRRGMLHGAAALLFTAASGASAAIVTHRPLSPMSSAQRRLAIDFLVAASQLLEGYAAAGVRGQAADGARAQRAAQEKSAALLRRVKHELRMRFSPDDMKQLALRWQTVMSSAITPPSPEVARLMLPMAKQVVGPLEALLPEFDPRRHGSGEARARRLQALAELRCQGVLACWQPDIVDWPGIDRHRHSLDGWVQERVASNPLNYIRLQTQWNLFASALPLRGGRCVPNAVGTLQKVGSDLHWHL